MPVILTSVFSAFIIFMTVFSMIKVLSIACKRKDISILKYRVLTTSFIVAGILTVSILPFGYQKIYEIIL
ncbi:hypothetical protein MHH37_09050 [Solibacillus sp. FSL K6-1781]|uniref:hypothetical protein n=1 Tax=unclassified Solibacillus TaxID=2637870 RepID=UPI0030F84AC6